MQILNDPLFETLWKNVIFCIFLQLTISILRRFVKSYLLFSFFCRNFASDFVTNSRGKSESSGSPKAITWLVLGKIGGTRRLNERGAVSPCDRVADDFVPFHRAIIEPLSSHYRGNNETKLLIIVDNCWPKKKKLLVIVDNCWPQKRKKIVGNCR